MAAKTAPACTCGFIDPGFSDSWKLIGPVERTGSYDKASCPVCVDTMPSGEVVIDGTAYTASEIKTIDHEILFNDPKAGKEAYLFQTVAATKDQMLLAAAEASGGFEVWCNGKKIFSNIAASPDRGGVVICYHNFFEIPLVKGNNVIAVRFCSGRIMFKLAIRAKNKFARYVTDILDRPKFPPLRSDVAIRVAPFVVDMTPPIDFPMITGVNSKVDTPIYIRGIVIDDGGKRAVLAAVDICYFGNKDLLEWSTAVAQSACVPVEQVFIHAVHQHDSLYFDAELDAVQKEFSQIAGPPAEYAAETLNKLCKAVAAAIDDRSGSWRKVAAVATAEKRIAGAGSNRRIMGDDGKLALWRGSMTSQDIYHKAPTGLIDPMLRTIAFLDGQDRVIAAMHYYASHPMAAYGRNRVSSDVPGAALAYAAQRCDKSTHHIYFNGCGGDVAFGKYCRKSKEENLKDISERLGEGMVQNLKHLEKKPMGELAFSHASFEFALHPKMNKKDLLAKLKSNAMYDPWWEPYWHASYYSIVKEWEKWKNPTLSRLSIGRHVHILKMPSESCVEYQLYAQLLAPEEFVACAAYGGGYYIYIPTARMLPEAGYEGEWGSISAAETEERYKAAIYQLLEPLNS